MIVLSLVSTLRLMQVAATTLIPTVLSKLVNVTIDDELGDPTTGEQISYLPSGAWVTGASCVGCTARPEVDRTYLNTWHDGTFNSRPGSNNFPNQVLTASVSFYGSAVFVYCILSDSITLPNGNSDMTFLIDSQVAKTFSLPAKGGKNYEYDVPVFAHDSLPLGHHNLTIRNGHVNGLKSLVLLDYIIYSRDDDGLMPSQSPPGSSVGPPRKPTGQTNLVGGILGAIIAVLLIAITFLLYRHRKGRKDPGLPVAVHTSSPKHGLLGRFFGRKEETLLVPKPPSRHLLSDSGILDPPPAPPQRSNMPSGPLYSQRGSDNRLLSVLVWQKRTLREAEIPPPPRTIPSVANTSLSTIENYRPRTPPLVPVVHRFTVMNH